MSLLSPERAMPGAQQANEGWLLRRFALGALAAAAIIVGPAVVQVVHNVDRYYRTGEQPHETSDPWTILSADPEVMKAAIRIGSVFKGLSDPPR